MTNNPLVTFDEANAYADQHPAAFAWATASESQKQNAIAFASTLVQSLPFNVPFSTVATSEPIKAAACEWAIDILRNPESLHSATAFISEKRVGDLAVKYRAGGQDFVPLMVRVYLAHWIAPAASAAIIPR